MRLKLSLLLMGIADTMNSDRFDGSFKKVALSISTKGAWDFVEDLQEKTHR